MATRLRLTTADELLRMPSDIRCELIAGEIVELTPAGSPHGRIAARFIGRLEPYIREHGLGEAYTAESGFRIETDPDTVLAPDAAFVSAARAAAARDNEGYFPGAPDLAVEVISPSERRRDVAAKVRKYLAAGGRMVVVIDPPKRAMMVHQSHAEVLILTETDVLDGGDVVPGWRLNVRDLFA